MNHQHSELAAGKWAKMTLPEQMANIGSEVSRGLNWKAKGNVEYCDKALTRALELIDLSLGCGGPFSRLREIARLREALIDYFYGSNVYCSSESLWRSYFDHFAYLARK
ncbi:MAG TPA: hypothetical protein VLA34_01210 [Candidatus Krumholzibacterium sp.]|nr:hypothetical protein [Candidatus Krumholzibacterium sp.]